MDHERTLAQKHMHKHIHTHIKKWTLKKHCHILKNEPCKRILKIDYLS